jgi:opacity protein-like surface antigen
MMKRFLVPLTSTLLFAAVASVASAQGSSGSHVGLAGGAIVPVEDAKDVYDTGYHGSLLFAFNAATAPLGVRIEGTYAKMDGKVSFPDFAPEDVRIGYGTANLVVGPRSWSVRPYLIGGGGVYRMKFRGSVLTGNFEQSQTKFGWNAGGGISFPIGSETTVFVEARYNRVETDPNPFVGDHFTFVPLTVGFVF